MGPAFGVTIFILQTPGIQEYARFRRPSNTFRHRKSAAEYERTPRRPTPGDRMARCSDSRPLSDSRAKCGRLGDGTYAFRRGPEGMRQTSQGSFSAVSKPNFANKYALESSRRDLHNALLCTVLESSPKKPGKTWKEKSLAKTTPGKDD